MVQNIKRLKTKLTFQGWFNSVFHFTQTPLLLNEILNVTDRNLSIFYSILSSVCINQSIPKWIVIATEVLLFSWSFWSTLKQLTFIIHFEVQQSIFFAYIKCLQGKRLEGLRTAFQKITWGLRIFFKINFYGNWFPQGNKF